MKYCEYIHGGKLCARELYDEKHCIFHSDKIDEKSKLFTELFWKEFENLESLFASYDFSGFLFPVYFQFNQKTFLNSVSFDNALFPGLVDFSGCRFAGPHTSFNSTIFLGITSFSGCSFSGETVSFRGAFFIGNSTSFKSARFCTNYAIFNWVYLIESKNDNNFNDTLPSFKEWRSGSRSTAQYITSILGGSYGPGMTFDNATFIGEASFSESRLLYGQVSFNKSVFNSNLNFIDTRIKLDSLSFNSSTIEKGVNFTFSRICAKKFDLSNSDFCGKTNFTDCNLSYENVKLSNSDFSNIFGFDIFTEKSKILNKVRYKINDFRFFLGPQSAARYPILNRKTKDAWFLNEFKSQHPFIYALWDFSSKCGQSILRWSFLSVMIVALFSVIYRIIGSVGFEMNHYSWFSYFYYSVVTFTTLGFGDITPKLWYSEMLVTVEVILGYVMLGGLISIFSNKLARRS